MQNIFITVLTPFIVGIAKSALRSLAQAVWDSLWDLLIEAVGDAEKKFKDGEYSARKKEQVVAAVMDFLSKQKKFSKLQLWAVQVFFGKIIDRIVDDLNKNYGHPWIEYVTDLKKYWAGRIPYID